MVLWLVVVHAMVGGAGAMVDGGGGAMVGVGGGACYGWWWCYGWWLW